MTDLDKFVNLYKSIGINVKVHKRCDEYIIDLNGHDSYSTSSDKFDVSYWGFYSEIVFDQYGKFISQGFFE